MMVLCVRGCMLRSRHRLRNGATKKKFSVRKETNARKIIDESTA